MPRIFLSHSNKDNTQAIALRHWLIRQRPELANEIFLDISEDTGLAPGQRWKEALRQANLMWPAARLLASLLSGTVVWCTAWRSAPMGGDWSAPAAIAPCGFGTRTPVR